jgi:lipid-A-disaccharide synthase-like uncharacterized protein
MFNIQHNILGHMSTLLYFVPCYPKTSDMLRILQVVFALFIYCSSALMQYNFTFNKINNPFI